MCHEQYIPSGTNAKYPQAPDSQAKHRMNEGGLHQDETWLSLGRGSACFRKAIADKSEFGASDLVLVPGLGHICRRLQPSSRGRLQFEDYASGHSVLKNSRLGVQSSSHLARVECVRSGSMAEQLSKLRFPVVDRLLWNTDALRARRLNPGFDSTEIGSGTCW